MPASLLPLTLAALASPQQTDLRVEVLHSNVPGWAETEVPGHPGVLFRQYRFDRMDVAPNGRWALFATTTGTPWAVLLQDGAVALELGAPAPWFPSEELRSIHDFSIDSQGRLLVACRTEGSGTVHNWIVSGLGGSWQIEAQSGDPIPGLAGATWGLVFENPVAIGTGQRAFSSDTVGGVGANQDELLWQEGVILAQQNVDAPLGQFGGTTTPWGGFDTYDGLDVTGDGLHWLGMGWLWNGGAAGPDLVTWDGTVQIQDGFLVPGSNFTQTVSQIHWARVANDDSWWAGGWNGSGSESWLVRNGVLHARDGDPVVPGSSKVWSTQQTADFAFAASNAGRTYIGGAVDWTFGTTGMLVMNDQILLEGFEQFDRDLNGLLDDNVEFRDFAIEGAGVDHLGRLIVALYVSDNNTGQAGDVLVRITPGGPLLQVDNLVAGAQATLTLSGATPGHAAVFAYSLAGAGPTALPTPYGQILLAVGQPFTKTPTFTVDGAGNAQFSQNIPGSLSGVAVWLQAAAYDAGGLALSNPRALTIQ